MPRSESTNNALTDLKVAIGKALEESKLKERRTICKRFYLTEAEDQQLESLRQGVNLSAFVRAKVFGAGIPRPRTIVPQINREAYIQLARLKTNCNQMAKALNTNVQQNRDLPLTQAYLDQLKLLEDLLVAIALQLGHDASREDI